MSEPLIFRQVRALISALPLTVQNVSDTLDLPLEHKAEEDGPMFTSYQGAGGAFREVELRVPLRQFGAQESLLNITLAEPGPQQAAVMATFGTDFTTTIPRPSYPAHLPRMIHYQQPWGRLSFGISRQGNNEVVQVTIADRSGATATEEVP